MERDELSVTHPVSRMLRNAINLDGVAFARFGIVAIKVMSGTDIISEWRASPHVGSRPQP
jgi:hypothetical protein